MTASGPKVSTSDEAELLACRRAIEFPWMLGSQG